MFIPVLVVVEMCISCSRDVFIPVLAVVAMCLYQY